MTGPVIKIFLMKKNGYGRAAKRISQREKTMSMFRQIAGFFRRLFSSKGFQRGLRIFFGVSAAYYIYTMIVFLKVMKDIGVSYGEALWYFFEFTILGGGRIPVSASVALGIAAGLVLYFNRKRRNREEAEPDEKAEKTSDTVQEEEIIETTHYKYH